MNYVVLQTAKGPVALCRPEDGKRIEGASDFLDLTAKCGASTIALERSGLAEGFFELRTGIAGEILQKVSNYRLRLIVLGDFSGIGGRALRDFIRESNGTGQVVFAEDMAAGIGLLR